MNRRDFLKKYIKPYIPQILIIFLLMFLSIYSDLNLPRLMSQIVDEGILKGQMDVILDLGLKMVGFSLFSIVLLVIASYFSAQIAMLFSRDIREAVFSKVLSLDFEQFESFGAPTILNRATDDISQIEKISMAALRPLVRAPLMFIASLIMAIQTNPKLSLIILVSAPLLLFIVLALAKASIPWFMSIRKLLDQVNLLFRERLTGIRVIRAFHREDYEEGRFEANNRELTEASIRVNNYMVYMLPTFNLIFNLTTIAVLWLGAQEIQALNMQVGDLMAYIQYINQIMFAVMTFAMLFAMFPNAQASYNRIVELLDTPYLDRDGTRDLPSSEVELVFDNVSFQYPGAERPVLSNISFSLKGGEKLAIIGGTGSGKSTILKLINRFYEVTEGEIRLNGVPIQNLPIDTLRRAIGYVPQKALLFSRSIEDNVNLAHLDNQVESKTWDYLFVAQAQNFVSGLEKQLKSPIAQGGKNLSGGQKQRLSIARAISKDPMVYLFDDSFSALDYATDKRLRKELAPYTSQAATIVVAQRVMTVTDSDQILVLEEGEIVARGKHDELLESSETYREIAVSQLGEKEVANG